eukprot:172188-Rhodomonas_salina.1
MQCIRGGTRGTRVHGYSGRNVTVFEAAHGQNRPPGPDSAQPGGITKSNTNSNTRFKTRIVGIPRNVSNILSRRNTVLMPLYQSKLEPGPGTARLGGAAVHTESQPE